MAQRAPTRRGSSIRASMAATASRTGGLSRPARGAAPAAPPAEGRRRCENHSAIRSASSSPWSRATSSIERSSAPTPPGEVKRPRSITHSAARRSISGKRSAKARRAVQWTVQAWPSRSPARASTKAPSATAPSDAPARA